MMTYQQKLRDPRWQKRRLEILNASQFSCANCGDKETELHVHHVVYRKGREPWEYGDDELIPLCAPCHKEQTLAAARIKELLAISPFQVPKVAALIDGYLAANFDVPYTLPTCRDQLSSYGAGILASVADSGVHLSQALVALCIENKQGFNSHLTRQFSEEPL